MFGYNFTNVVIMSVHDPALVSDFWRRLKGVNDLSSRCRILIFCGYQFDHTDRPHLSKLF
jgi:hypothetical protein